MAHVAALNARERAQPGDLALRPTSSQIGLPRASVISSLVAPSFFAAAVWLFGAGAKALETSCVSYPAAAPPSFPSRETMVHSWPSTLFRKAFNIKRNDDLSWVGLTQAFQVFQATP